MHSTISAAEAAFRPIRSEHDLVGRVTELIGSAHSLQLWLLFLDEEGLQLPLMLPMTDIPATPDDDTISALARIESLAGMVGAASVAIVLERPGGADATDDDHAWLSAIETAATRGSFAIHGVLLAHDSGVVPLRVPIVEA